MESKFFIIKANKFIHAINNIKKIISLLFILNVITINLTLKNSKAQFFYNNGAEISIRQGAYVKIGGSVSNDNYGELENQGIVKIDDSFTNNANTYGNGDYIIKGNWYNNNIFTSGNSNVILDGGNQNIGGSLATYFNNLILQGNGIKQLLINSYVLGTLSLNDQELATGNFKIFVENPSPSSITRTTGFVSSTGQGMLSRKTLSNSIYLFPVGSSSGTLRYRPVEITPADNLNNTYQVRMANVDATNEGYDRSELGSGLCTTNPLFYHLIDRVSGSSSADITIYYDTINDGYWQSIANWQVNTNGEWINLLPTQQNLSIPLSSISYYGWQNFNNKPFILAKTLISPIIAPIIPLCENNKPLYLNANPTGGTWSGNGIINNSLGIFDPALSGIGEHEIVYSLNSFCGSSDTTKIIVNQVPTVNANIKNESCTGAQDGSVILNISGGTPSYTYNWNNNLINYNNIIDNLTPGIYYISITDAKGCQVSMNIQIESSDETCYTPHIFVPNIFSPNGDGQNDILYVRGQGIKYFKFIIYDRWGEKIFETTDLYEGWDGKYKGNILNSGNFVYYLNALLNNNKTVENKGTITLVK